jgi:hypothetical protein
VNATAPDVNTAEAWKALALRQVNMARAGFGLPILEAFPKGDDTPEHNPVATALWPYAPHAWPDQVRVEPIMVSALMVLWQTSHGSTPSMVRTPEALRGFLERFLAGHYPELREGAVS